MVMDQISKKWHASTRIAVVKIKEQKIIKYLYVNKEYIIDYIE